MSGGRVVTLSPAQTQLSTDVTAMDADGVAVCNVSVTVKNTDLVDGEPNPMAGLRGSAVVLAVTPSTGVTITQPTGVADASGTVMGSFVSTNPATASVTATVLGEAVTNGASVVVGGGAPSGDFFADSFASGSQTNSGGFVWSAPSARLTASTTEAYDDTYSMRFRYGPDAAGADSSVEMRFNTGRESSEVWVEWYLYVPDNFVVRSESPANNKLFAFWANSYSTTGDTQIVFEYERDGATNSRLRVLSMNGGANTNGTKFTHVLDTTMAGTWKRFRVHLKCATTPTSADGVIELWRDSTKVYEYLTHNLNFSGGNNFFKNGYFLGWANSGFADETLFYIDKVRFDFTNPSWSF